jgi:hypothetical protein
VPTRAEARALETPRAVACLARHSMETGQSMETRKAMTLATSMALGSSRRMPSELEPGEPKAMETHTAMETYTAMTVGKPRAFAADGADCPLGPDPESSSLPKCVGSCLRSQWRDYGPLAQKGNSHKQDRSGC